MNTREYDIEAIEKENWRVAPGVTASARETNSALAPRNYDVGCEVPKLIACIEGYWLWWCSAHHQPYEKCCTERERILVKRYRDHLGFLYRWISRLNGDKPHDTPEKSWREYVAVMVHYPLSPWQTGDWFED